MSWNAEVLRLPITGDSWYSPNPGKAKWQMNYYLRTVRRSCVGVLVDILRKVLLSCRSLTAVFVSTVAGWSETVYCLSSDPATNWSSTYDAHLHWSTFNCGLWLLFLINKLIFHYVKDYAKFLLCVFLPLMLLFTVIHCRYKISDWGFSVFAW